MVNKMNPIPILPFTGNCPKLRYNILLLLEAIFIQDKYFNILYMLLIGVLFFIKM